jgi:phosphoribosylformylglycinamidine synthase
MTNRTGRPSVLIPIAPGTNRNQEMADAFAAAGADPAQIPLQALRDGEAKLADHQLLALPGGFSYGDALGAGRLLGLDLVGWLGDQLREAVAREMPVIGVCNGFQALVRAGLLPGPATLAPVADTVGSPATAALVANQRHHFECRWVTLRAEPGPSVWLSGLSEPLRCPVAHGEGRLLVTGPDVLAGRVAFRYVTDNGEPAGGAYPANPNGSVDDVAGLVDTSGLVVGLMPHPEDHIVARQDPQRGRRQGGRCLSLFENGVAAVTG